MEKKTTNLRPKFELEDLKIDEMEKDMSWLNLESKSEKEAVTSLSPYPGIVIVISHFDSRTKFILT